MELIKTTLKSYIRFRNGKTSPDRNDNSTIPVYGSNGVIGFADESNAEEFSLIIGRVGSYCGSVYLSEDKCWVTDNAIIAESKNKEETLFWYFYLLSLNLNHHRSGSGQPLINQSILNNLEVIIPESLERRIKVGSVLYQYNKKIELNNQINDTLEAMAQAIFKSWFVDFDPVHAKAKAKADGLDAEGINRAAMAVIASKSDAELTKMKADSPAEYEQLKTLASLFPDQLEESELGLIPQGWEVSSFGELLDHTIGGNWGKEQADDKHSVAVKILRGTDLPRVYQGDDSEVPVRFLEPNKLKTRKLQAGDIVIEISGGSKDQPTGRTLYITDEILNRLKMDVAPTSFCRLFRPKTIELGLFLGIYMQIIYKEGKTWQYQNQSTGISNFQTKIFLERELVATPSFELILSFYQKINPFLSKITSDENQKLAELRDALLPKLLSGEIEV